MIPESFSLEVYAYGERNQIIENCRVSFAANAGDLLDFKMFSDMLIHFIIEIPPHNVLKLNASLERLNWKTQLKWDESLLRKNSASLIQGNVTVYLSSGTGQRKDIIPAVPG